MVVHFSGRSTRLPSAVLSQVAIRYSIQIQLYRSKKDHKRHDIPSKKFIVQYRKLRATGGQWYTCIIYVQCMRLRSYLIVNNKIFSLTVVCLGS